MTIIEQEREYPNLLRWSPCSACDKRNNCLDECLRFREYTEDHNTRNRGKRFKRFAEKMGAV